MHLCKQANTELLLGLLRLLDGCVSINDRGSLSLSNVVESDSIVQRHLETASLLKIVERIKLTDILTKNKNILSRNRCLRKILNL